MLSEPSKSMAVAEDSDLALLCARLDLLRRSDTHCECEMAIVNCIGHIAEQSYEVAEDIVLCLVDTNIFEPPFDPDGVHLAAN